MLWSVARRERIVTWTSPLTFRDEVRALGALEAQGYTIDTDWRPVRVELIKSGVGWVDLHPVNFDQAGHGRQAGRHGGWFDYPPDGFTAGHLAGVAVPCLSRNQQLQFRRGYQLRDVDDHDLQLLDFDNPARVVDRGQLLIVVGLPGSGKSTLARALAEQHAAVRFNPDQWMSDLEMLDSCVSLMLRPLERFVAWYG